MIHDGILSGRSGAGKVDPEMVAPYVAQAARDMKLGVFDCRVIATEDDAQTMVGVSAIALKIHADADRRGNKAQNATSCCFGLSVNVPCVIKVGIALKALFPPRKWNWWQY